MKVYIIPNISKSRYLLPTKKAIDSLESYRAIKLSFAPEISQALFGDLSHADKIEECDLVVSIGGDGMLLTAFHQAFKWNKRLVGINTGRLGKLCALDLKDLNGVGDDPFLSLRVSLRSVLTVNIDGVEYNALNDIVICSQDRGKVIDMKCNYNGDTHYYRGDGLIIATPTGSSAYNLSAGGALLEEEGSLLAVTPICPSALEKDSRVVQDNTVFVVDNNREGEYGQIYVDGELAGEVRKPTTIKKASKYIELLCK